MNNRIKVGDLVEDCSLMPGVVMEIKDEDVSIRRLDIIDYGSDKDFSQCSLNHCGIVKITSEEAKQRFVLGKEKLIKIWEEFREADYDFGKDYFKRVEEEYNKIFK